MDVSCDSYSNQVKRWPAQGRHILAHFDAETIFVYQAFREFTATAALIQGSFDCVGFSYGRMSWIKPNFLWMMYRSGWAAKRGQEMVLAVRLRRSFFDSLLAEAVASNYDKRVYETRERWRESLGRSEVRLQWDPDHDPAGRPLFRRALQLGLRGRMLDAYGRRVIEEIIDMTPFVRKQQPYAALGQWNQLRTPVEDVYVPESEAL